MTDLRTAAQQALEAWQTSSYGQPSHQKAMVLAMTALRAALAEPDYWQEEARRYAGNADYWRNRYEALAQPEQEPIITKDGEGMLLHGGWHSLPDGAKLYTAPPQREPLTEEEIDALAMDEDGLPNSHLEFARAIERAHGIGEQP